MRKIYTMFEDKLQKQTQLKIISSIANRSNVTQRHKTHGYNIVANIVQ